jgi:hypothetical protein
LSAAAANAADRRFLRDFHRLRHNDPLAAVRRGLDHARATGRLRFPNVLSALTQRAMRDGMDPQARNSEYN